jgi:hypothetical protein
MFALHSYNVNVGSLEISMDLSSKVLNAKTAEPLGQFRFSLVFFKHTTVQQYKNQYCS